MASDMKAIESGAKEERKFNPVAAQLTGLSHLDLPPDNQRSSAAAAADDEQSFEIEPTCAALATAATSSNPRAENDDDDEQILSAQKLLQTDPIDRCEPETNKSPSNSVCCIEIDLGDCSGRRQSRENSKQETDKMFSTYAQAHYISNQPTNIPSTGARRRTFTSDSPPKLSFSSWRMREYFNSFKGHSQDTKNLYQFFKSIRTELVACLMFALISSHSLIVCRAGLVEQPSPLDSSASSIMWPQLISGLIVCLLVASLTQVFGHVSGCHLIPSISVALFIKGHIGRTRLASYLGAQAVGALLGVGLLALLTSSQVPASSSSTLFLSPMHDKSPITSLANSNSPGRQGNINLSQLPAALRRRKREAQEKSQWDDIDLSDIPGSETILLSIMEQQQQQQTKTSSTTSRIESAGSQSLADRLQATNLPTGQGEKTITLDGPPASTYLSDPVAPSGPPTGVGVQAVSPEGEISSAAKKNESGNDGSNNNNNNNATNDESRVLSSKPSFSSFTAAAPATTDRSWIRSASSEATETISKNLSSGAAVVAPPNRQLLPVTNGTKLKRAKRTKQRQQQPIVNAADPSNETITSNDRDIDSEPVTSNMLAWALPQPIMSADSIRQCSLAQPRRQLVFSNCLSLSNASQMFVFQLLACSLVVLVYLVNVDPRRVDVGFKSLSIGFAYFIAFALTINSGGFYGNPFQLLALNWFSSSTPMIDFLPPNQANNLQWRSEWWIYLITPLIGGLFGAISHEYIDFSSLKNRDRQLHLRRSFHSLQSESNSQPHLSVDLATINSTNRHEGGGDDVRREQRRGSSNISSVATASSGSLSTNLEPLAGTSGRAEQQRQPDRGRKLEAAASYSQQLSREHKRLRSEQHPVAAARRASDFDANFLISSCSSSSSPPPPPLQKSLRLGRHQLSSGNNIGQAPACCSRRSNQMMSTSVM